MNKSTSLGSPVNDYGELLLATLELNALCELLEDYLSEPVGSRALEMLDCASASMSVIHQRVEKLHRCLWDSQWVRVMPEGAMFPPR